MNAVGRKPPSAVSSIWNNYVAPNVTMSRVLAQALKHSGYGLVGIGTKSGKSTRATSKTGAFSDESGRHNTRGVDELFDNRQRVANLGPSWFRLRKRT